MEFIKNSTFWAHKVEFPHNVKKELQIYPSTVKKCTYLSSDFPDLYQDCSIPGILSNIVIEDQGLICTLFNEGRDPNCCGECLPSMIVILTTEVCEFKNYVICRKQENARIPGNNKGWNTKIRIIYIQWWN